MYLNVQPLRKLILFCNSQPSLIYGELFLSFFRFTVILTFLKHFYGEPWMMRRGHALSIKPRAQCFCTFLKLVPSRTRGQIMERISTVTMTLPPGHPSRLRGLTGWGRRCCEMLPFVRLTNDTFKKNKLLRVRVLVLWTIHTHLSPSIYLFFLDK